MDHLQLTLVALSLGLFPTRMSASISSLTLYHHLRLLSPLMVPEQEEKHSPFKFLAGDKFSKTQIR